MKTIILDRDGVILKERGEYTYRLEDAEVLQSNIDALIKWAETNRPVQFFVLTNQGGIAKGLYTMFEVNAIHSNLQKAFHQTGGVIREFFTCPHHQDHGLCYCRKPKTLLFEKMIAKYSLDASNCLMVGDKERDTIPAMAVGMKTLLIESNQEIVADALDRAFA